MKVLFVCLGNICRSPMAEGLFRQRAGSEFTVASRATSSWEHGNPVHPGSKAILKKHDIDTSAMFSEPITAQDFKDYDVIIGMDQQNVANLKEMAPAGTATKIHLFLDILATKKGQDVPDPWYTGDFEATERLVSEGVDAWIQALKETPPRTSSH